MKSTQNFTSEVEQKEKKSLIQFLNYNKKAIIIVLCILTIASMLLPMARGKVDPVLAAEKLMLEDSTNYKASSNINIFNAALYFGEIKNAFGIDSISTTGIDKNKPADEIERTTLVLADAVGSFDTAIAFLYLALFLVFIGLIITYVKPNGLFSAISFFMSGSLLGIAIFLSADAAQLVTTNISPIGDYYGFNGTAATFSFSLNLYFIVPIALCFILVILSLILKSSKQSNNEAEKLTKAIIFSCAAIAVLSVIFITIFLFLTGAPAISKIGLFNFLFGTSWQPADDNPSFGILNLILTSFTGMIGAIVIGVPIGLLVAVCIAKMAPNRLARMLRPAIDLLSGIPSVIYGAVGAMVLVPFVMNSLHLPTGATLLAAIIVLSVMILPTIISLSETSIRAVPDTYMEASLALGVSKEYSIFHILIPAARSGIMAGILLGVGRAIGEAMAIILVAGNVPNFPNLFVPVRFLTTGIVAEMGYATGLHRDALFAIGMVLFIFIFILNSAFHILMKKAGKKYE